MEPEEARPPFYTDDSHHVVHRVHFHDCEAVVGLIKGQWDGGWPRLGNPFNVKSDTGGEGWLPTVCCLDLRRHQKPS